MRLMNEIRNEGGLDYLVHMGDQVYADGELHRLEAKIADDDDEELYEIAKESAWKQVREVSITAVLALGFGVECVFYV